jgi:hypothetical protein
MINWPYKRVGLSWGDNLVPVVFYFFSVHLKSGPIREVASGGRSLIRGGSQYGLIREVASGGRSIIRGGSQYGLIREVASGGRCLIRGGSQYGLIREVASGGIL